MTMSMEPVKAVADWIPVYQRNGGNQDFSRVFRG
jgi:hypothetical protein